MFKYNGEYCHFLSAISDKYNFAIVVKLFKKGPMTFQNLNDELGFRRNFLRQHLHDLLGCSYIFSKKVGSDDVYYLNKSTIVPLIKVITKHIDKHHRNEKGGVV